MLLFSRWYAGGMPGQLKGDSKWRCYKSLFRSPLISRLITSKLSMYEASVLCGFRVIPQCQTQPAIARYSKRCKTRSGHVWNGRVPGKCVWQCMNLDVNMGVESVEYPKPRLCLSLFITVKPHINIYIYIYIYICTIVYDIGLSLYHCKPVLYFRVFLPTDPTK